MHFKTLTAGFVLAVSSSAAVYAQDVDAVQDAVDATAEAAADAVKEAVSAPAAPTCELHVFPTLEGQAQTTSLLSGFGAIGAIADAANNKKRNIGDAEYLKEALGPQFQVEALSTIDLVSELKLPEGTEIFYETPIADRKISTKAKTRLTSSTAPCYAELLITQNLYQKKAIYGRSLNNRYIYKDFRDGKTQTNLVKGRGGNGLSQFPPENEEEEAGAKADLLEAFTKNFLEYSKGI